MKKIVKLLSVLLILVAVFLLSSCAKNDELKEKTELMLNSLITNDFDEAYSLVSGITTKEEFKPMYTQIRDYIEGVKEYELSQVGVNVNTNNGITLMRTTYLMTTNAKNYIVESQIRSDIEGLYGFNILESQIEGNGIQCGTVTSMKGANLTQWIFLIIGFFEIAFVIAVFIDALKQKIDKKGLWLALILLGTAAITVNTNASGINFTFNAIISLVNNTAFIRYATGASSIRIMIPIAAIVYLFKRKQLIDSYKQKIAPVSDACSTSESTEEAERKSEVTTIYTENNTENNE